jgi:putative tryptophan/tyrosine transport system substrate-binding protein
MLLSEASGVAMRRRDFFRLVGSAAATWPFEAHAQPREPLRRVAILEPIAADTPGAQARYTAFLEGLKQLGWTDGQNIQIVVRWGADNEVKAHKYSEELVALAPDVILAVGSTGAGVMLKATHTIPIVFVIVPDPVGSGFVERLSRPGGNATGFMFFEYNLSGKWLELLKQVAPSVTRAAVLRDPTFVAGIGQFAVIQAVAPSVGIEVSPIDLHEPNQIERAIATFAESPNGGLIQVASGIGATNVNLIITAAARYKLPAVYTNRAFVAAGGLISYGPNVADQYRRAAGYVDRILRGRNLVIYQWRPRTNTNWSSTSRLQGPSASQCRSRCFPAPTR